MSLASLNDVCCASLPEAALGILAGLRSVPDVRVRHRNDRFWLWWRAADVVVLRQLLAVPGVELYVHRDGLWYQHGHALPTFHLPRDSDTVPLYQALTPAPVVPASVPLARPRPVALRLVRDLRPRVTTAVLTAVGVLAEWAELVPTARLAALSAARSGQRVLLRGRSLPALPGGERYWGNRLLLRLGYRAEPALPEPALRQALGLADDELALFTAEGMEVVPLNALEPLTRAGSRLVSGEGAP